MPTPPTRAEPLPGDWKVQAGLDVFLEENGYAFEDYDAPRTPASLLGISFSVPNTPRHRWAIMLHDLHHVATGFGTDARGEGEISAWEARRGLRGLGLYVGAIIVGGVGLGLALVREIASHHGGSVRCLPHPGGGTVFEVDLRTVS